MNAARLMLPLAALLLCSPAHAVTIDWVTVGDPGNANDTTGYGGVGYSYQIGKYEVTIQQYTDFLNAVAQSDPYGLYSTTMNPPSGGLQPAAGIAQSGSSGSYTYSVIGPSGTTPPGADSPGNRPVTNVSWWDAARFANWLQNGQGSGDTETGAYTIVGGQTSGTTPARNPGATYYIPTENEWYKAAYYSPALNSGSGGYYTYATQSNVAPGNVIGSGSNQANYPTGNTNGPFSVTQSGTAAEQNYLTNVGAFTNSASFYGTFDQNGNVAELNDLAGAGGDTRVGRRGGNWLFPAARLQPTFRESPLSSANSFDTGFRLAAPVPVPEPSTCVMALAGIACGGWQVYRRSKQARRTPSIATTSRGEQVTISALPPALVHVCALRSENPCW